MVIDPALAKASVHEFAVEWTEAFVPYDLHSSRGVVEFARHPDHRLQKGLKVRLAALRHTQPLLLALDLGHDGDLRRWNPTAFLATDVDRVVGWVNAHAVGHAEAAGDDFYPATVG